MYYNNENFRYNANRYPAYCCYGQGLTCSEPDNTRKKENKKDGKQATEIKKGGKNEMSFTGMIVCTDGILAFGDSRSTSIDIFNTPQKLNDDTKKVFSFNDFIMTESGRNVVELYGEENSTIPLAKFVKERKERCRTPYDFIDIFMDEVIQSGPYYFTFGIKSNDEYGVIVFEIINGSIAYHAKKKGLYANAHDTTAVYSREFDELVEKNKADGIRINTDTAKKEIESLLTATIHFVDERYAYNVVGLPLQFAVLK